MQILYYEPLNIVGLWKFDCVVELVLFYINVHK